MIEDTEKNHKKSPDIPKGHLLEALPIEPTVSSA
jgi:hypothetical protein